MHSENEAETTRPSTADQPCQLNGDEKYEASYPPDVGLLSTPELSKFRINSLLWMAGFSLLLVPITTLIDVPVAIWFAGDPLPRELGDALDLSIVYAHGSGIFLILVSVILLAPGRRWHVPRLATLAMGGGAVATVTKMFVLRQRPHTVPNLEIANYDHAWDWTFDWGLQHVAYFDASTRAFPSAYLATATALTVGLCVVFPRGRWLFVSLCLATMTQRMFCGAHFVSDLFGSAAVGLFWAYVCQHPKLLGTVFDKMEPEADRRTLARATARDRQEPIISLDDLPLIAAENDQSKAA